MDSRKSIWNDLSPILVGQILCTAAMIGIFAVLGYYDTSVLLGGIFGSLIAIANFFFMTLGVDLASKKAEAQDVAGGQKLIQFHFDRAAPSGKERHLQCACSGNSSGF